LHQLKDCDDLLWCQPSGEILEASTANISFIGREGDALPILTPPPASGILQGITRTRILTLLKDAKIYAQEMILTIDELPRFDEASLTSKLRWLIPISQIASHPLHTARPKSALRSGKG
jgi:branched-chain amino acid aminotransferase